MIKDHHSMIITIILLSACCIIQIESFLIQQFTIPNRYNCHHHHQYRQRCMSQQLFVSTSTSFSSSSSYSSGNNDNNNNNNNNRKQNPTTVQVIKKQKRWKTNKNHHHKNNSRSKKYSSSKSSQYKYEKDITKRLQNAKYVEERLYQALEGTKELIRKSSTKSKRQRYYSDDTSSSTTGGKEEDIIISFPSVRECNSALAILGDTNDFKRALQLFGQMRKSQMLVTQYNSLQDNYNHNDNDDNDDNDDSSQSRSRLYLVPPSPTLVTYSTLMSRAVFLGKPSVALRLWRLMILQKEFYTNLKENNNLPSSMSSAASASAIDSTDQYLSSSSSTVNSFGAPIVPDIKAVNILMNVFAKMADHESASRLMEQLYKGDVQRYDPSQHNNNNNNNNNSINNNDDSNSKDTKGSGVDFQHDQFEYLIQVVPKLKPNIVTYNTLIDACHRSGNLDAALEALSHLKTNTHLKPDARTYTSLISTVARRDTLASGSKDPDLAFTLFDEMIYECGIQPNGMTYCALIDVCGRCGRSDLALKVLRMMLRQREVKKQSHFASDNEFEHEVGAWSAAINACGKAGRLDTAIRIFHSMRSKFGVKPNIITCGCLMDCLLKSKKTNYLEEALNILVYMQEEGLEPSEVMYTSLITSAGRLARTENKKRGELVLTDFGDRTQRNTQGKMRMKALDVYEELLLSLTNIKHQSKNKLKTKTSDASNNLIKAFLVFQEMTATGADPDIACYNALLRACAEAGDIPKLREVMWRIKSDGLIPNENSWKECLRGSVKAKESKIAEEFWDTALNYKSDDADDRYNANWVPNVDSFVLLIASYTAQATHENSFEMKLCLYRNIVNSYLAVFESREEKGFNCIDINLLHQRKRCMTMILRAINFQIEHEFMSEEDMYRLSALADEINDLDCLQF